MWILWRKASSELYTGGILGTTRLKGLGCCLFLSGFIFCFPFLTAMPHFEFPLLQCTIVGMPAFYMFLASDWILSVRFLSSHHFFKEGNLKYMKSQNTFALGFQKGLLSFLPNSNDEL